MPKRIYLTRHAQATHNVDPVFESASQRLDAPLTPEGRRQAEALHLQTKMTVQKEGELLVASPLRRPMQTMLLGYPDLLERLGRNNVILLPELQEITNHPCDTGSPRADLEADAELAGLDFSGLDDDRHGVKWPAKEGIFDHARIGDRTLWVRKWLRSRKEEVIVVVAHGDVLRILTGDRGEAHWANTEVRLYQFASADDNEAELIPVKRVAKEGDDKPTSSQMEGQE